MGVQPNSRILRDFASRHAVHSNELLRRAYKYIARNTSLPSRVRHTAQLELNSFPSRSRPTAVKERCTATGRGRGILTDFGLCRYQFRQKALAGELPGVEKASW
ncbi:40S ribosomal protein mrp2, mitochondrial [Malassezia sp. CBS 17886]|nr:40S ribosomal protein mrp2, mitochondrial [Malassezia sp. CBS 17886]